MPSTQEELYFRKESLRLTQAYNNNATITQPIKKPDPLDSFYQSVQEQKAKFSCNNIF